MYFNLILIVLKSICYRNVLMTKSSINFLFCRWSPASLKKKNGNEQAQSIRYDIKFFYTLVKIEITLHNSSFD